MPKATRKQRLLLIGLLTIALMAPPVLLGISGQFGLAAMFVYGGIIAISAVFYDMKLAVIVSAIAGVAGAIAALLNPYTLAGAVFFGVLTGASALTAKRGIHSPVLMVPVFISFILVAPPPVPPLTTVPAALMSGAVLTLGGLWATASARLLLGQPKSEIARKQVGLRGAIAYGLLMAIVLGVAAWAVLTFAKFHQGAWLLLTLIILLQPSAHDTVTKSLQRLAGTLVGSVVALALILIALPSTVDLMIGGILIFAALSLRYVLKRPYWEYVTVLTPAVILLSSTGFDQVRVAEDRVGFTLIASTIAILLAVTLKAIFIRKAPQEEST
jgi:hypothetical protein